MTEKMILECLEKWNCKDRCTSQTSVGDMAQLSVALDLWLFVWFIFYYWARCKNITGVLIKAFNKFIQRVWGQIQQFSLFAMAESPWKGFAGPIKWTDTSQFPLDIPLGRFPSKCFTNFKHLQPSAAWDCWDSQLFVKTLKFFPDWPQTLRKMSEHWQMSEKINELCNAWHNSNVNCASSIAQRDRMTTTQGWTN